MAKVNFDIPLDFLRASTPPMIGIDISSSSIKMVELSESKSGGGYTIERYAIEQLPKDAVSDGNINNLDAVSETLQQTWKRLGSRIKNAALALPAAAVITKKILLPLVCVKKILSIKSNLKLISTSRLLWKRLIWIFK